MSTCFQRVSMPLGGVNTSTRPEVVTLAKRHLCVVHNDTQHVCVCVSGEKEVVAGGDEGVEEG